MSVKIEFLQEWEHETQGRCEAIDPSGPAHDPEESWRMRRLSDDAILYMHRHARENREWKRGT